MRRAPAFSCLLALLPLLAACDAVEYPNATLAVRAVDVVDVQTGQVHPDRTVVVEDDRIVAVSPTADLTLPDRIDVIDGEGSWLIPGLWDMHTHAFMGSPEAEAAFAGIPPEMDRVEAWEEFYAPVADLLVANGVTGVREMWGGMEVLDHVREEGAAGRKLMPRIVAAGHILGGSGPQAWPGTVFVSDPASARAAVDSLVEAGAQFVKVYEYLDGETHAAIHQRARELGLPVAGHLAADVPVVDAVEAGQRSIEHMIRGLEDCGGEGSAAQAEETRDHCAAAAAALVENGTRFVPTLVALRGRARMLDPDAITEDRIRYVARAIRPFWSRDSPLLEGAPENLAELWTDLADDVTRNVRWLSDQGVTILVGTDFWNPFAYPGFGLHDEMELLVEAGLTPLEALQGATIEAARYFEATDSLGTVEPGRLADLVLLEANPLDDIRNTTRIRAVVLDGRVLTRADLDRLQAEAADFWSPEPTG